MTISPFMLNSETEVASNGTQRKRRVLIVGNHPIFRVGLGGLIRGSSHLEVCADADSAPAALEAMRHLNPDLVLLDLSLREPNGLELIELMRAERPDLAILVISMHDEAIFGLRALKAGALGYVMKTEAVNHVEEAISKVLQGKIYVSPEIREHLIFKAVQLAEAGMSSPLDLLSDRELEVLQLLGKGISARSIAEMLHISVRTIEIHRARIKKKLRFRESEEMVKFAIDWVAMNVSITPLQWSEPRRGDRPRSAGRTQISFAFGVEACPIPGT